MLGISPALIGLAVSVSLFTSTIGFVAFGILADKVGRRRILFAQLMISVIFYLIYFFAREYPFFLLAAILGGLGNGAPGSIGAMNVENVMLAEKVGDSRRTLAFNIQWIIISIFTAIGSFATVLPDQIAASLRIPSLDAIRLIFALSAILLFVASVLVLLVSESPKMTDTKEERYLSKETQKKIAKLSVAGAFDGLGVGLIYNLFSLWFYIRFGIDIKTIGYIFTAANVVQAIGFLLGTPIAKRLGLIRSIYIGRLAACIAVTIMAFMPTYTLAALMYIIRNTLQHFCEPLRSSYLMAIFNRNERASAASISQLTSAAGTTIGATLSGYMIQNLNAMTAPLSSALSIGIGVQLYYFFFKNAKPPEEQTSIRH
jgi:MFS family permease